jgi:predicted ThiF/HesA family dinucleotide-utilizing enzyme
MVAKAESTYAVAKEKCDDLSGNPKDVCVKEAKAVEVKALADAKMGKKVGEAKVEAVEDKKDANYKVEAEKCDALAGDAKSSCMAAARLKFGKS